MLNTVLAAEANKRSFLKRFKKSGLVLIGVAVGGIIWMSQQGEKPIDYRTEVVTESAFTVNIAATGNLQPTNQVDVSSELSGILEKVWVEENDVVKKGQVLAQLDRTKLKDQFARSSASLNAFSAKILQAQATLKEAQLTLMRRREMARETQGRFPSQADLDAAQAAFERAVADLKNAQASRADAAAAQKMDATNVEKALIRSPIDGIVLTKKAQVGQTVASSLQAPVLFVLAEDLSKMQLQVDVDEADVGQVKVGQPVHFTVDAYSGRTFPAKMIRVGYGSQVKEGVVTYKALMDVNNSDLSLRPGMTATANITTLTRDRALLVPNAALRFSPPVQRKQKDQGAFIEKLIPKPPKPISSKPPIVEAKHARQRKVWVLNAQHQPVEIPVKVAASNGKMTEILAGELKAGMAVLVEAKLPKP